MTRGRLGCQRTSRLSQNRGNGVWRGEIVTLGLTASFASSGAAVEEFPYKSTMANSVSPAARLHVAAGWPAENIGDVEYEQPTGGARNRGQAC